MWTLHWNAKRDKRKGNYNQTTNRRNTKWQNITPVLHKQSISVVFKRAGRHSSALCKIENCRSTPAHSPAQSLVFHTILKYVKMILKTLPWCVQGATPSPSQYDNYWFGTVLWDAQWLQVHTQPAERFWSEQCNWTTVFFTSLDLFQFAELATTVYFFALFIEKKKE